MEIIELKKGYCIKSVRIRSISPCSVWMWGNADQNNTDTFYAVRIFDFFKITLDFLSRFNLNNKLNKIFVFYVFRSWNNLKRTHHLSENCHHCFELSSCWFCLLIKNPARNKISNLYMLSNTRFLFISNPKF